MEEDSYVVLGFGQQDYPEEFIVLVHESERCGIPFNWLTEKLPSQVEQLRASGNKDHDIARILGYIAGGDCKFGFYLGVAEGDIHFYLSGEMCLSFLKEYGPGSDKEKLVEGKQVRFLVCDHINFAEIREGKPLVYVVSKTNDEGKARPYIQLNYRDDDFYSIYLRTMK
jgi:hypothetical protein